jgi:hypothetical protein
VPLTAPEKEIFYAKKTLQKEARCATSLFGPVEGWSKNGAQQRKENVTVS